MRHWFSALFVTFALLGCATTRTPAPTLDQIIAMHQAGDSADKIIERIRNASYAVYRVNTADIVRLNQAGVPDKVIDYLRQTEIDDAVRRERQYFDGPWWGWPRFHILIQR